MAPRAAGASQRAKKAADSDDDAPVLAKFEGNVQAQYLNKPVDPKAAEHRLRSIIAELNTLKNDLVKSLEVLQAAAGDVAESTATHEDVEMGDEIPEDGVSLPCAVFVMEREGS